MQASIANVLRKIATLYSRIFNKWRPAVKVAGSNTIHLAPINKLVHSLYGSKKSQELLKTWIFRMKKPPP